MEPVEKFLREVYGINRLLEILDNPPSDELVRRSLFPNTIVGTGYFQKAYFAKLQATDELRIYDRLVNPVGDSTHHIRTLVYFGRWNRDEVAELMDTRIREAFPDLSINLESRGRSWEVKCTSNGFGMTVGGSPSPHNKRATRIDLCPSSDLVEEVNDYIEQFNLLLRQR